MKVKVLKMYKDKHTKILHKENEEIEITEERYKELTASPLGVFVKEIKEEVKKELPKDDELPKENTPIIQEEQFKVDEKSSEEKPVEDNKKKSTKK